MCVVYLFLPLPVLLASERTYKCDYIQSTCVLYVWTLNTVEIGRPKKGYSHGQKVSCSIRSNETFRISYTNIYTHISHTHIFRFINIWSMHSIFYSPFSYYIVLNVLHYSWIHVHMNAAVTAAAGCWWFGAALPAGLRIWIQTIPAWKWWHTKRDIRVCVCLCVRVFEMD